MKRVDITARQQRRKDMLWAYERAWRLLDVHIDSGALEYDDDEELERKTKALQEVIYSLQAKADRLRDKGVTLT
jgi:hypothetical protein